MNDRESSSAMDIRDAEARLSELIRRVEGGEEITLGRSGEPAARLIPVPADFDLSGFGDEKGEIWTDPACEPGESFGFVVHGGSGAC